MKLKITPFSWPDVRNSGLKWKERKKKTSEFPCLDRIFDMGQSVFKPLRVSSALKVSVPESAFLPPDTNLMTPFSFLPTIHEFKGFLENTLVFLINVLHAY